MTKQIKDGFKPRVIGMGTIVALTAALLIGYWNIREKNPPPIRNVHPVNNNFSLPNPPDIARILADGKRLELTEEQISQFERLRDEWTTASGPVEETMRSRASALQNFLNDSDAKPVSQNELQKQAEPVSEITGEYISLRNDFQRRALSVLTPEQRASWKNIVKEMRDGK